MKVLILISILSIMVTNVFAWAPEKIYIEGKIGNFNSTSVELTKNGNTVTVPRDSISKEFKIREGHYAKGYLRYKDIKLKNSK